MNEGPRVNFGMLAAASALLDAVYLLGGAKVFGSAAAMVSQVLSAGGHRGMPELPAWSRFCFWLASINGHWVLAAGLSMVLLVAWRKVEDRHTSAVLNLTVAAAFPLVGLMLGWGILGPYFAVMARGFAG